MRGVTVQACRQRQAQAWHGQPASLHRAWMPLQTLASVKGPPRPGPRLRGFEGTAPSLAQDGMDILTNRSDRQNAYSLVAVIVTLVLPSSGMICIIAVRAPPCFVKLSITAPP